MVGLRRARGMLDEKLVAAMQRNNKENPQAPLYFVDCRSQTAALANFVKGGGFESTQHYRGSHVHFMDIENIHALRENPRWLDHVRAVLLAAKRCATAVAAGSSLV